MIDETGSWACWPPRARRLIDEAQALMSVLAGARARGHGPHRRRLLVGQDRMSRVLKARRRDRRYSAFSGSPGWR